MIRFDDGQLRVLVGDALEQMRTLADGTVNTIITSPPYWGLRDYGQHGQLGQEPTPEGFVDAMVEVFREARRVLRDDGTLWLNLGDTYAKNVAGESSKSLVGIPWRVALALKADGWILRSDIIWAKPAPMPEPVKDRPTKSHEYLFLLAKSERYYYDAEAIQEPAVDPANGHRFGGDKYNDSDGPMNLRGSQYVNTGKRNKRDVWTVPVQPYAGAHFATFPEDLITPCVLAGAPVGGVVLDPFGGSGTTGLVANRHGRRAILVELNPNYAEQILTRNRQSALGL
jgi:site-specific DNA-methyltransferase (adenine-specific)